MLMGESGVSLAMFESFFFFFYNEENVESPLKIREVNLIPRVPPCPSRASLD